MAISSDNVVQYKTGSFDGASSVDIDFDSPITQDSAVVFCGFNGSNSDVGGADFAAPSGGSGSFLEISASRAGGTSRGRLQIFAKRQVAAGEQSYDVALQGTASLGVWFAFELAGAGADIPANLGEAWYKKCVAVGAAAVSASTVASDESGFVPDPANTTTDAYDALGVAVFCANNPAASAPVISGFDLVDYPTELQEFVTVSKVGASHAITMTVCLVGLFDIARYKVGASCSPNSYMASDFVALYGDGSKWSQKYEVMTGFELGTATGATAGSAVVAGTAPFDFATNLSVGTTFKRTGNYAGRFNTTSAIGNCGWSTPGALAVFSPDPHHAAGHRFHFYFDNLPSGDCEIGFFKVGGSLSNGLRLWYRSASGKLAVKIGSNSDVLSDAAISADKWIGVDIRYHSQNTTHTADWQVDYDSLDATGPVAQTHVDGTGMTGGTVSDVGYGWNDATTADMWIDDIAVTKQWMTYPIGDIRIVPLKVDPAGTITISGTSSNFGVYTNNADIGAWNATNARAAIDDVPPVVGASSDGITQISVAASDYASIPMETFTAAPDNCLRAVRWYVPGWARSTNPASLSLISNDGTVDVLSIALADHGFDDTATVWLCGMHRRKVAGQAVHYLLTQTLLDALTLRVGFSDDANPDVGIHSVLAELAYQPAVVYGVFEAEDGAFSTYVRQDPVSGSVVSYLVTTPMGDRGATFTATIRGASVEQYVDPNTTYEHNVGASSITEVTSVGMAPDPNS